VCVCVDQRERERGVDQRETCVCVCVCALRSADQCTTVITSEDVMAVTSGSEGSVTLLVCVCVYLHNYIFVKIFKNVLICNSIKLSFKNKVIKRFLKHVCV